MSAAEIRELYYDPATFGSVRRVWQAYNERHPDAPVTQTRVRQVLGEQEYFQRTKRTRRVFMPIIAKRLGSFQADVMFFDGRAFVTMVELTTRLGFARQVSNKKLPGYVTALRDMLVEARDTYGLPLNAFAADNEFNKKAIRDMLHELGIPDKGLYFPAPGAKTTLGKIEAFNFSLRHMFTQFAETISRDFGRHLPAILENYNRTVHTQTRQSPAAVAKSRALQLKVRGAEIVKTRRAMQLLNSFRVGDRVRVNLRPIPSAVNPDLVFAKYAPTWGRDVHTVTGFQGYRVRVSDGNLYAPRDLQHVTGDPERGPRMAPEPRARTRRGRPADPWLDPAAIVTAPRARRPPGWLEDYEP
jgi:hypothetical protein